MMTKQEYSNMMQGSGMYNKYVIDNLYDRYKKSFSKQAADAQFNRLAGQVKQSQDKMGPPKLVSQMTDQQKLDLWNKTMGGIATGMKQAGGFKEVPVSTPPPRHITPPAGGVPHRDTKPVPSGTHKPNPAPPAGSVPHIDKPTPILIDTTKHQTKPTTKPKEREPDATKPNPPAPLHQPSQPLPTQGVVVPPVKHNYMSEQYYTDVRLGHGFSTGHADYLNYLKQHNITLPTEHISSQINTTQQAHGLNTLAKGTSIQDHQQQVSQRFIVAMPTPAQRGVGVGDAGAATM